MDEKIRKIEKKTKGVSKDLKQLEAMDKRYDKIVEKAKKIVKRK